jgi:ACT domain-containing protein
MGHKHQLHSYTSPVTLLWLVYLLQPFCRETILHNKTSLVDVIITRLIIQLNSQQAIISSILGDINPYNITIIVQLEKLALVDVAKVRMNCQASKIHAAVASVWVNYIQ